MHQAQICFRRQGMAELITNQDNFLKDVIDNILPKTKNVYFLVGYFYFSGIKQIYQNLKNKKVKILIGMDIEIDLKNKIREFEVLDDEEKANILVKDSFYKNFIRLFNETDYFDSEEKTETFGLFLQKIKDGTLEIRKTFKPTHAKMYVFEYTDEVNERGQNPGSVIIGSSNLSYSGLKGRVEINTILRDKSAFEDAKRIFDELWEESIEIASSENPDFFNNVLEKIWYEKLPKPYLLFIRVLLEYFSQEKIKDIKLPSEITKNKFFNLKYQADAIESGINVIKKHDGVIIADVVGLGKSIIASAIAYNLRLKTIIIAPPHLLSQWEDYGWAFGLVYKTYSSGKIEQALKENNDDEEKLIIIDEAHKYRNELTNNYALLHKLCQGNKVILLTATPFNNRPQDLFALIKLFQIPAKSTLRTIDNLWYRFRELIKEYKKIDELRKDKKTEKDAIDKKVKEYADKIRDLLSPFIIRRSRLDLEEIEEYKKDLKKQNIKFPEVNPPELIDYDLGELEELYFNTLEKISPQSDWNSETGDWELKEGFIGARYKPVTYLKDFKKYKKKIKEEFGNEELFKTAQVNLAKFMRRLLVRRFESSLRAFESTLDSMIKSTQNIIDWYEKTGKVPIYKKGKLPSPEELFDKTGEDLEDLNIDETIELKENERLDSLIEKGLILIDKNELRKKFGEDLKKDLALLKEIKKEWFEDNRELVSQDPKFSEFVKVINEKLDENPQRKIVIFTEFADTADYIADSLKEQNLKVLLFTGKNSSKTLKQTLKENFDAGLPEGEQKDAYDILVATDAISEGVNLNRAGIIFNYDIPYNPTRVIQRVGRINRINKLVFDKLYIYNFFPTAQGESEISIRRISTLKIALIHALLGEDTKFLTDEEELKSYFRRQYERLVSLEEEKSWEVPYLNILNSIKNNDELIKQAYSIPNRVKVRRTVSKDLKGVLIFGKKADDYIFKFAKSKDEIFSLTAQQALKLFEAHEYENADKPDESFDPIYQELKSSLFKSKKQISKDKGLSDTIKKLRALRDELPNDRDYFKALLYIVENLGALPEKYLKQIRDIDTATLEEDIKKLKEDIPISYIAKIKRKVEKLEGGKESVIIAEQLI